MYSLSSMAVVLRPWTVGVPGGGDSRGPSYCPTLPSVSARIPPPPPEFPSNPPRERTLNGPIFTIHSSSNLFGVIHLSPHRNFTAFWRDKVLHLKSGIDFATEKGLTEERVCALTPFTAVAAKVHLRHSSQQFVIKM